MMGQVTKAWCCHMSGRSGDRSGWRPPAQPLALFSGGPSGGGGLPLSLAAALQLQVARRSSELRRHDCRAPGGRAHAHAEPAPPPHHYLVAHQHQQPHGYPQLPLQQQLLAHEMQVRRAAAGVVLRTARSRSRSRGRDRDSGGGGGGGSSGGRGGSGVSGGGGGGAGGGGGPWADRRDWEAASRRRGDAQLVAPPPQARVQPTGAGDGDRHRGGPTGAGDGDRHRGRPTGAGDGDRHRGGPAYSPASRSEDLAGALPHHGGPRAPSHRFDLRQTSREPPEGRGASTPPPSQLAFEGHEGHHRGGHVAAAVGAAADHRMREYHPAPPSLVAQAARPGAESSHAAEHARQAGSVYPSAPGGGAALMPAYTRGARAVGEASGGVQLDVAGARIAAAAVTAPAGVRGGGPGHAAEAAGAVTATAAAMVRAAAAPIAFVPRPGEPYAPARTVAAVSLRPHGSSAPAPLAAARVAAAAAAAMAPPLPPAAPPTIESFLTPSQLADMTRAAAAAAAVAAASSSEASERRAVSGHGPLAGGSGVAPRRWDKRVTMYVRVNRVLLHGMKGLGWGTGWMWLSCRACARSSGVSWGGCSCVGACRHLWYVCVCKWAACARVPQLRPMLARSFSCAAPRSRVRHGRTPAYA